MQGLHLTADLHGCPAGRPLMADPQALRTLCLAAVGAAGLQAVGELFHRFSHAASDGPGPAGITGVVLLKESHLAVHTWPELAAVTLDVYVCNLHVDNSPRALSNCAFADLSTCTAVSNSCFETNSCAYSSRIRFSLAVANSTVA